MPRLHRQFISAVATHPELFIVNAGTVGLAYDFGMGSMPEDADNLRPRKLTHEQGRAEQRLYWSTKSISERLAAMTALNKRMREMRGIFLDESKADWNARWVRRADGVERPLIPKPRVNP